MGKFAKELGFFVISILLVSIPFITGLLLGGSDGLGFLKLCGTMLTIGEVLFFTGLFCYIEEDVNE